MCLKHQIQDFVWLIPETVSSKIVFESFMAVEHQICWCEFFSFFAILVELNNWKLVVCREKCLGAFVATGKVCAVHS